eukprot:12799214-Alexandrium_andersonii.AAC.1
MNQGELAGRARRTRWRREAARSRALNPGWLRAEQLRAWSRRCRVSSGRYSMTRKPNIDRTE